MPTWNYAVVHAYGAARVIDDPEHTRRHVEALAAKFERGRAAPWVPDYDVRRLAGIVGIEIRVDELEGKFKLSQNRSAADRARVVAQLDGERARQRRGARAAHDGCGAAGLGAIRQTCDDDARSSRGIHVRTITIALPLAALAAPRLASAQPTAGEDSQHILTVDHYVPNQSIVPAIDGQTVQLYVRERVKPATIQRGAPRDDRVVLFVHGAGTPAEVAFDVPYARLQLDGVSRRGRLRRVLDGHDRLRPLDAAERHERGLQSLGGAADGARPHAVQRDARGAAHDDRVGLGRHRRRRRVHPRAARRAAREPRRLVARRPARRRLRVAQSRQGREARAARAGVSARLRPATAAAEPRARRRVQRAVARRVHGELGSAGRLPEPVRARGGRGRLARDARVRSRRRDVGTRRAARAEHDRRGDSARPPSSACRRRR